MREELPVFEQGLVGRVDDDRAVVAVEQGVITRGKFLARRLQADHGGNAQVT